jgi:hypothetical protein
MSVIVLSLKLNVCVHSFTKSKATVTSLVTYFNFVTPVVCSQCLADAIYFDLSSAFDLVTCALLLQKLADYGHLLVV